MTPFKKLVKRAGAQPYVLIAGLAAVLLLAGLLALYVQACQQQQRGQPGDEHIGLGASALD